MLLTRLYLRNFRVYEDELDLALPPGLVGIYGPNGAGKSTLLEAINFALWGRARTERAEIRSAGVGGDCVVELELEHEGHLYLVRRWLTGINATMRAEAHCDGLAMTEGSTDTRRYVGSILGMDETAFRASVFAEQKQLAAFSDQAPAERRRLVLGLLGITPLDAARDAARRDARDLEAQLGQLRGLLPDLSVLTLEATDAEAAAGAAGAVAAEEAEAAASATRDLEVAQARWSELDQLRQRWEALVVLGQAARAELDREVASADELAGELRGLDAAAAELAEAEADAGGLERARARHDALRSVLEARRRVEATPLPPEPPDPAPAEQEAAAARETAAEAAKRVGEIEGSHRSAEAAVRRAAETLERSAALAPDADCPLCGQPLGAAWASVQEHRRAELAAAQAELAELAAARDEAAAADRAATAEAEAAAARAEGARRARHAWQLSQAARSAAEQALRAALEEAAAALGAAPAPGSAASSSEADPARLQLSDLEALVAAQGEAVAAHEAAASRATALRGRLERRAVAERLLAATEERLARARQSVEALREELRALGYEREALDAAAAAREVAAGVSRQRGESARSAELTAESARTRAEERATRLAEGTAQHSRLGELESEARHLARLAVLLSEFRNTVVASVGPRLAAQAAELFGELTDREYDQLLVDPETYELQISDAGRVYGLDRFSGSEVDLANLALRVAISEHVRFQSGGSVGLLVLDEVFGPLDEDRKARMLQALEQLRGRFRQVLVVTHDASIKEQLPNALEVVKLPGRRATARMIG